MPEPVELSEYQQQMLQIAQDAFGVLVLAACLVVFLLAVRVVSAL